MIGRSKYYCFKRINPETTGMSWKNIWFDKLFVRQYYLYSCATHLISDNTCCRLIYVFGLKRQAKSIVIDFRIAHRYVPVSARHRKPWARAQLYTAPQNWAQAFDERSEQIWYRLKELIATRISSVYLLASMPLFEFSTIQLLSSLKTHPADTTNRHDHRIDGGHTAF